LSSSAAASGAGPGNFQGDTEDFAGLVQSHGLVLVVREPLLRIVQASTSAAAILNRPLDTLLLATLHDLGGDLEAQVRAHLRLEDEQPALADDRLRSRALRCKVLGLAGAMTPLEGLIYRVDSDALLIELQPETAGPTGAELLLHLGTAVQRISEAATLESLCECAAQWTLQLSGYERVCVQVREANGLLRLAAQACARSASGLVPAPAPVPALARCLAMALLHQLPHAMHSRIHAQVDTRQAPAELLPLVLHGNRRAPLGALDLAQGNLGSLSTRQLQRLSELGVAARASVSLLHDGQAWGWIVCDHPVPHHLPARVRAALELLAEAVGTRIASLEHHARARVTQQLRGLEQRLVEATSLEGDWRQALVRDPKLLLAPLQASGAVLFQGEETFSCGCVPKPGELHALLRWMARQTAPGVLHCSWLQDHDPAFAALAPVAARVLAVRLSASSSDWLLWLRGAHAEGSDHAGAGGDETESPVCLSPSPSPDWSRIDKATASGFGRAVAGISVQVDAVRMLIAESQLAQLRGAITASAQPMVVFSSVLPGCHGNDAFFALAGRDRTQGLTLDNLASLFADQDALRRAIAQVRAEERPWRGEMSLLRPSGSPLPVAIRAEPVPAGRDGLLGLMLMIEDLSASLQAESARQRLEASLTRTELGLRGAGHPELVGAILVNAGIAAMDISDSGMADTQATLLAQVEASTQRAADLFRRIRSID
jgi:PAS domain-containing protein